MIAGVSEAVRSVRDTDVMFLAVILTGTAILLCLAYRAGRRVQHHSDDVYLERELALIARGEADHRASIERAVGEAQAALAHIRGQVGEFGRFAAVSLQTFRRQALTLRDPLDRENMLDAIDEVCTRLLLAARGDLPAAFTAVEDVADRSA